MKKQASVFVLNSVAIFGALLLLFSPSVSQDYSRIDGGEKYLPEIAKYRTPNTFFSMLPKELGGLQVSEFSVLDMREHVKSYLIRLSKDSKAIDIVLREFNSIETAEKYSMLNLHISMGAVVQDQKFGDEGRRIFYNGFSSLAFRKGLYEFSVSCDDEKLAEMLAGYAIHVFDRLSTESQ